MNKFRRGAHAMLLVAGLGSTLSGAPLVRHPPAATQPESVQEPPMPAQIRRFFADADVVAVGRVSALRVESSGGACCRVSFRFAIERFLKGEDVAGFASSFDARGASEAALREYYAGEMVFFYRKSGAADAVQRDSIWIASSALGVEAFLKESPNPALSAYPYVRTQSIHRAGPAGANGSYSVDISYPQFEGATADFSGINRRFADEARTFADEATPKADARMTGSYEQGFALHRPGVNAIAIATTHTSTGGAHGNSGTSCTLIDLRTGRAVGPEGVFGPGDAWLTLMKRIVRTELKDRITEPALVSATLDKALRDPQHYCYRVHQLELIFDRYTLDAAFAAGSEFNITISYARLKPVLRAGGPISAR